MGDIKNKIKESKEKEFKLKIESDKKDLIKSLKGKEEEIFKSFEENINSVDSLTKKINQFETTNKKMILAIEDKNNEIKKFKEENDQIITKLKEEEEKLLKELETKKDLCKKLENDIVNNPHVLRKNILISEIER